MNCYPLKVTILVYLFSSFFYIPAVTANVNLPPILDYYPNCSYKTIQTSTTKMKTEQPWVEKTTLALLTKLRRKAKSLGADALIIIDKEINKEANHDKYYGMSATDVKKYTVSYEAEFIKHCQTDGANAQKLTSYDHQGNKVLKTYSTNITLETKIVFTPPAKAKLNHPIITNKELSLAQGIYGVNIGTNYQQVIDNFGDPSIVISMFEGEIIVGYGRKHWFRFQNNILVKVQSNLVVFSPALLNRVPLRDFFDETPWLVDNKIMRQTTFSDVKSAMKMDVHLNKQKKVVIKGQDNTLILSFTYRNNSNDNEKNYFLDNFSLESNVYSEPVFVGENRRVAQFEGLETLLSQLTQGEVVELGLLSKDLGDPVGRITISATSYVDIYNSSLLVEVKKSELVSIQLLEELFNIEDDLSLNTSWSLGNFIQGKSITELRKFFPEHVYELDDSVQIDSDEFELTLLFDENDDQKILYEAKVTIY